MKTFVIVVETAFIAFCAGVLAGALAEEEILKKKCEASEEATPA